MKTTRREFLYGVGATAAAMTLLPARTFGRWRLQELNFANKSLNGGSYVIGDLTSGGNVLTVKTEAGVVMIDTKFAHTADQLLADVTQLMKEPPVLVFNTHHHADHTGGNWLFSPRSGMMAHENMNARIAANVPQYIQQAENHVKKLEESGAEAAKIEAARQTVEKIRSIGPNPFHAMGRIRNEGDVERGGVHFYCYHFGNGHTDNDLVIYMPHINVVHTGDLLFHNLHPYIDRSAKADTVGWQKALQKVHDLINPDTVVVPGHGEVTNRGAISKQIEYFDRLRDIVSKAIAEGKSRDEVIAMKPEAFKDYGFDHIRPVTFGGMYDELKASAQP